MDSAIFTGESVALPASGSLENQRDGHCGKTMIHHIWMQRVAEAIPRPSLRFGKAVVWRKLRIEAEPGPDSKALDALGYYRLAGMFRAAHFVRIGDWDSLCGNHQRWFVFVGAPLLLIPRQHEGGEALLV